MRNISLNAINSAQVQSEIDQGLLTVDVNPVFIALARKYIEIQKERNHQKGWVLNQLETHPEIGLFGFADWLEIAKMLDYQPGWAYHKHKEYFGKKIETIALENHALVSDRIEKIENEGKLQEPHFHGGDVTFCRPMTESEWHEFRAYRKSKGFKIDEDAVYIPYV